MFNSIFKIIYFILLIVISMIRKIFTNKYRKMDLEIDKRSKFDFFLLGLSGLGMIIPLIYVFSSVLDFANYPLPQWTGWVGSIIFLAAIYTMWRSHVDLGMNWTPVPVIRKEHRLITHGIFKFIRHPMYAAHIYWAIAQIMILHNWIAGYSFLAASIPFYILRIKSEERMLVERFGEEYQKYMTITGRFLPKIFKKYS